MKLKALKKFKHAENGSDVYEREKGEIFEVTNEKHAKNLIESNLAKILENNNFENKVILPEEYKIDISGMTVTELKEMAKKNGVKNYSSMNKQDLIFILS